MVTPQLLTFLRWRVPCHAQAGNIIAELYLHESYSISKHVVICKQCRTEAQAIEVFLGDSVRHRKQQDLSIDHTHRKHFDAPL